MDSGSEKKKNKRLIILIVLICVIVLAVAALAITIPAINKTVFKSDADKGTADEVFSSVKSSTDEATADEATLDEAVNNRATNDQTSNKSSENRQIQKTTQKTMKLLSAHGSGNLAVSKIAISDKGYKYTAQDGWEIKMDGFVIYGVFSYRKPVKEKVFENWGHGGRIFDSDKNVVNRDDALFWSDYESKKFAAKIPNDLPNGKYSLELYQISGNDSIGSLNVEFQID